MSLASGIKSFASGYTGGDRIDRENERQSIARDQNDRQEEAAQRTRNMDNMYEISGLANDLGISKRAGEEIDIPKLEALLQKQRDSGKFDPKLERFVTLVGNKDLSVERNPGFSFTNLQAGPEGTLTMQGTYEGDETPKFATTDRKPGADAEVGFSTTSEVAGLVANQYNQSWNRPGVAGFKREVQLKGDILEGDQSIADNEVKIQRAVGQLTNELEEAILRIGGEQAPAIATKLKRALAGKPYPEQLEILQQYGSELKVPVSNIVTPEVQEAAKQVSVGVLRSDGNEAAPKQESFGVLRSDSGKEQNPIITAMAKKGEAASDEDIIQGKVQVTQEEVDALQERLKAQGITSLEEMNKATREDQQSMRLMLSSIAVNEEQRATYLTRLNNITATGSTDYNAKELGEAVLAERQEDRAQQAEERQGYSAETSRMTAETARLNYFRQVEQQDWNVSEKVGERIRNNFTAAKKAIYGVDGDGNINSDINFDEGRFFSEYRGAFEDAYREFRSAPASTPRKAETQVALNSMISMGIQALAESEEYGSFGENFLPDGAINYIDGNDELLSRLQVQSDGSVIVYDPTTGSQQDESVPKSVLRKIFGDSGYAYFIKEIKGAKGSVKARANSNKAG